MNSQKNSFQDGSVLQENSVMIPKILIPVDDSPTARQTIQTIMEQSELFPKQLTLLHVINIDHFAYQMIADLQMDMVKQNAGKMGEQLLERVDKTLSQAGFENEFQLIFGDPRQEIATIANEQDFNLVVIGRHEGGGQIRDVLFGSVANHVLHNVKCPVLLF
jgi:nucleotide-binding universal stress UspA family protein